MKSEKKSKDYEDKIKKKEENKNEKKNVKKEENKKEEKGKKFNINEKRDKINDYHFNGFERNISCITQSKNNGNLFITCWDGNIYIFDPPNIDYYLELDMEERNKNKSPN